MARSHDVSRLFPSLAFQFLLYHFSISFSHRYTRKLSYVFIHGLFGVRSRVFAPILFHFPLLWATLGGRSGDNFPFGYKGCVTLFAGAWFESSTLSYTLDISIGIVYFISHPKWNNLKWTLNYTRQVLG